MSGDLHLDHDDVLPGAIATGVEAGAEQSGVSPELALTFAQAVLRRLRTDRLAAADPGAVTRTLLDLLDLVATGPGPTVRVVRRPGSLTAVDTPTTAVQLHGLDRPFVLSTVLSTLHEEGLDATRDLHPVLGVVRDEQDRLVDVVPARDAEVRESLVHLELDRLLDHDRAARLEQRLQDAMVDLEAATDDWGPMRAVLGGLAGRLRSGELAPRAPEDLRGEVAALLEWLDDDNIVLLGARRYTVDGDEVAPVPGSGLGVLRDELTGREGFPTPDPVGDLPRSQVDRLLAPQVLRVTRTAERSRVQRRTPYDAVVVIERDEQQQVTGLTRILGLFTRGALAQPARATPVLRRRLAQLLEHEDVVAGSHDEARLIEVFEAIPRDELFAADHAELHRMVVDLVVARERDEVQAVVRHDPGTGTVSVVATIPRYRYEPAVRRAFTAHLEQVLATGHGPPEVDVDVSLADDHEVLVRFAVHLAPGPAPDIPSGAELGEVLRELTRAWDDEVDELLVQRVGEHDARRLATSVVARLPGGYRELVEPSAAVDDIVAIDAQVHDLDVRVVAGEAGAGRVLTLVRDHHLVLSDFLPLLEAHGLDVVDERPHRLDDRPDRPTVHLHDFGVRGLPEGFDDHDARRLAASLRAAWEGRTSSDSLHRLVLSAGLTWREAALLRAYRRYRRQVGTRYTPDYVNDALAANPEVVRLLVAHVHARFDPDRQADEAEVTAARDAVLAACDDVARLDHDRILRGTVELVDATLRTNLFVDDDGQVVVLKLDPSRVSDMPAPVPHRELFVLGPDVEGIHLRGGAVARGGLRWSDRQDDVRTEVLGLMKAQMLKNAVIVPTGAKGGFVLRNPPADRTALRTAVQEQYEVFVDAMLQVTDDIDGDTVVPPPRVRRWDGDDPYLVVAADKGTATFSDVANGIALEHGFWLGDAFASGGSNGYDHKALGITARGAWVAVRRHLLELGIHPEKEPVSVVGVGDMSGDVFGNGLLSSRTLRLVAAFDHRDVFIDPDPDPEASFDERQRLFDAPRSSWQDYDRDLLSPGGMVVSRQEKSVVLTDEVRTALRIDDEALSPAALVRAILRAPVDLLWFGGIGTYVKDPDERHDEVGDRANDELRVDADELRARVVGEGANLAVTQRARIRFARRGGRIDQDAVHNVGGVDCSDHEVNVKILLDGARRDGVLDDDERDRLLVAVTDDVVTNVLRDVDLQVWRLSRDAAEGPARISDVEHLLRLLETDDGLDREVDVLPEDEELQERARAGAGLTRPELATVLGWAKRRTTTQLLDTAGPPLVDAQAVRPVLAAYMPAELEQRFPDQLRRHRLRRELVATRVANEIVDRMGPTFPSRVAAEADVDEADVVTAWWAARDVTGADPVWRRVEGMLDAVGPLRQDALSHELEVLLGALTRRYLTDPLLQDVDGLVARDRAVVQALASALPGLGTEDQRRHRIARVDELLDDLVPEDLATWISCTRDLATGPEVAATLRALGWDADRTALVADVLLHLLEQLGLSRLHRVLDRVGTTTVWRRRLRRSLAADLRSLAARAAHLALEERPDGEDHGALVARAFVRRREQQLERARRTISAVEGDREAGLDGVTVALRALRTAVEDGE